MKFPYNFLFFGISLLNGCTKDPEVPSKEYPYVVTEVPAVSDEGVCFSADLVDAGSTGLIQYGFVWSDHPLPTTDDYYVFFEPEIKSGRYSFNLTSNLEDSITYYVRAYAKSDAYEVYGKEIAFSSQGCLPPGILSFTPQYGSIGTEVIIYGENIGTSLKDYVLKFGDNVAQISYVDGNTIHTKVPYISKPERVRISIQNAGMETFSDDLFDLWFPWDKKGSYPYKYNIFNSASYTFNGKGYIIPLGSNNLVEFNPETGSLMTIAKLPENSGDYPLAAASPEFVFARLSTGLYKFNPLTSEWSLLYKFPDPSGSHNDYLFCLNNTAFLGFGQNLSEFNEATGKWIPRSPFDHMNHLVFLNAYSYQNSGYIVQAEFTKNVAIYRYDPVNDAWENISVCPAYLHNQPTSFFSHFLIEDKIYTDIGKYSNDPPEKACLWQYDITTNSWSVFHEIPDRTAVGNCIAIDGRAYAFFGDAWWEFTPEKN
jgi:hypothetical protein